MKGAQRKFHIEGFHYLHCSPNIIRAIKSRHMSCTEEKRDMNGILAAKCEGRRPLGRPRHRYNYNI